MRGIVPRWSLRCAAGALLAMILVLGLVPMIGVGAQGAFTDAEGRFSFAIPTDWQQDTPDDEDTVVQFQMANPYGTFYVVTDEIPDGATLETFAPMAVAKLKAEWSDFQPTMMQPMLLNGTPAQQIDFTATSSGQRVAISQVYVMHDDVLYILTIAAPAQNLDILKRQASGIIATWTFLAPAE